MVATSPLFVFAFTGTSLLLFLHHIPLLTYLQYLNFDRSFNRNNVIPTTLGSIKTEKEEEKERDLKDIPCSKRPPPLWPSKLIVVQRRIPDPDATVQPQTTVTYYNRKRGGNVIQMTNDVDPNHKGQFWDLELDDHSSYFFYPTTKECFTMHFPVGVLREDWLAGAESLGESMSWDGSHAVCGYTKLDFIDYYVDKETGKPSSWYFHGMKAAYNVLYYYEPPEDDELDSTDWSVLDPPEFCPEVPPRSLRTGEGKKDELDWAAADGEIDFVEEAKHLELLRRIGRG